MIEVRQMSCICGSTLSPRVRGSQPGPTPACGEANLPALHAVHPRVCGEAFHLTGSRSTPACAGKPS